LHAARVIERRRRSQGSREINLKTAALLCFMLHAVAGRGGWPGRRRLRSGHILPASLFVVSSSGVDEACSTAAARRRSRPPCSDPDEDDRTLRRYKRSPRSRPRRHAGATPTRRVADRLLVAADYTLQFSGASSARAARHWGKHQASPRRTCLASAAFRRTCMATLAPPRWPRRRRRREEAAAPPKPPNHRAPLTRKTPPGTRPISTAHVASDGR